MHKKLSNGWVLSGVAVLVLLMAGFAVYTAETARGASVTPRLVAGNPDCGDVGYNFGFKLDNPQNGTFTLTNPPGELTGGAPSDPSNSVTLTNLSGNRFDWSATLGIDAVIVKAGPNAYVYDYSPEAFSDTNLVSPQPDSISHIEFCYDYNVTVTKTATTSYTRTCEWTIDKSVTPATWDLFTGDSGTSEYTVSVGKSCTDSDFAVSGNINVANNTPLSATITGVTDTISGVGAAVVACGVTLPYVLPAGQTLVCTYSASLPDASSRTNTATVTTSGAVAGGSGTADIVFGDPTTVVNGTINVDDTNGSSWSFSDNGSASYTKTFTCDGDEGQHNNTATIRETGQSDSASVTVNCYDLTIRKSANESLTRTWTWDIDKTADESDLTLAPGEAYLVTYWVTVDAASIDSEHNVVGNIQITNNHPTSDAPLTAVSDLVSPDIAATVNCPTLTVPAGDSITCTYSTDLPDSADRTNTATATLQNYSYDSDGVGTPSGTTDFSGTAAVDFDNAVVSKVDECIDVSDTLGGVLGTVCADQAPHTFHYSLYVGPYSDPEGCGGHDIPNTASFVTNNTGTTGSDSWNVHVFVPCDDVCTLTQGYWRTHSEFGPAPYDDTWTLLSTGASTPFFLSGKTYYQVLWTAPAGNVYYNLAHQYIAAQLNTLNGATMPANVQSAFNEATTLFNTYTPAQIAALKGKGGNELRAKFVELAGILGAFNEGAIGPGHCDEQ